ncbi:MAG TPA: hypothetical protein PLV25_01530, partial [Opitutales bacterium]|nr:hypothetical protein [Opitutales bacterium]
SGPTSPNSQISPANGNQVVALPADFFKSHKPDAVVRVKAGSDGRVSENFSQQTESRYIVVRWVPDQGNKNPLDVASVFVVSTQPIDLTNRQFRALELLQSQELLDTIYGIGAYQNIQLPVTNVTLAPVTSTTAPAP